MRIWPRFFFVDIAFLMLLIVIGVRLCCTFAAQVVGGGRALFALAAIAMAAISAGLAARNYAHPKQDLAGAHAFALAVRQPGERIYAVGHAGENFRYFGAGWPVLHDDAAYGAARAEPGPMLLVVGFPTRALRDLPLLARDATSVLNELRRFPGTLGDGDVIVFRRD